MALSGSTEGAYPGSNILRLFVKIVFPKLTSNDPKDCWVKVNIADTIGIFSGETEFWTAMMG
jgi:hypothetical protein